MVHNLAKAPNPGAVIDPFPEAIAVEEQRIDADAFGPDYVRMILVPHMDSLGGTHPGALQSSEEYGRVGLFRSNLR
jgi:hypothetical protein